MNAYKAAEILEQMLEGIDPCTGEVLPEDHVCMEPEVLRALHIAIMELRDADDAPTSDETDDMPHNRNGRLNASRPWTNTDDAVLEQLYACGTPAEDICEQMQRRMRGVQKRLVYLGLAPAETLDSKRRSPAIRGYENAGKPWTKDEDIRLSELYHQGWQVDEIAKELRRSELSVFYRLDRNGLFRSDTMPAWTERDTEELRELFLVKKMPLEQIAEKYGRTVPAIQARLFYMGLLKELPFSILS